jgi:hypothetical protein
MSAFAKSAQCGNRSPGKEENLISKFSKSTRIAGAIATAFTGALLVTMPAAPAYAQKGSRLCGYMAPGPDGIYVGKHQISCHDDTIYLRR